MKTITEQAKELNQYVAMAQYIHMHAQLVEMTKIEDGAAAEKLRDEMDLYWYAAFVYGKDEDAIKKGKEFVGWLTEKIDKS